MNKVLLAGIAIVAGVGLIGNIKMANANDQNVKIITENQVNFVKKIDSEMGTNLSSLVNEPLAYTILDTAYFACGNKGLQEKVISALGGTPGDVIYASNAFENIYCNR
jgi:hypothetical protein